MWFSRLGSAEPNPVFPKSSVQDMLIQSSRQLYTIQLPQVIKINSISLTYSNTYTQGTQ